MENETNDLNKTEWWNDEIKTGEQKPFLKLKSGEFAIVKFLNEGEKVANRGKYGGLSIMFKIMHQEVEKIWFVNMMNYRTRDKLKALRPLTGKTFSIVRTGEGVDTRYEITTYPKEVKL